MSDVPTAAEIQSRLAEILQRIDGAGGTIGGPNGVKIVAVTKTFSSQVIDNAVAAGLLALGENYAQELMKKAELGSSEIRWHFIGGLQSNKIRKIARHVAMWQTIDRVSLAKELAKRSPGAEMLIQVNTTAEEQKSGVAPSELAELVETSQNLGLTVRGLMTVGPTEAGADPRPAFAKCKMLADTHDLAVVSMGMSGDYELAVAEGSTMVRIGSGLFGHRHAL